MFITLLGNVQSASEIKEAICFFLFCCREHFEEAYPKFPIKVRQVISKEDVETIISLRSIFFKLIKTVS
jgi:hypothetical protein